MTPYLINSGIVKNKTCIFQKEILHHLKEVYHTSGKSNITPKDEKCCV